MYYKSNRVFTVTTAKTIVPRMYGIPMEKSHQQYERRTKLKLTWDMNEKFDEYSCFMTELHHHQNRNYRIFFHHSGSTLAQGFNVKQKHQVLSNFSFI